MSIPVGSCTLAVDLGVGRSAVADETYGRLAAESWLTGGQGSAPASRSRVGQDRQPNLIWLAPDRIGQVGAVERQIRERAVESLVQIPTLAVRSMFSGFGFYVDGLLVAAAWDAAFRLRYREGGRWVYKPVNEATLDDPSVLVPLVRERAEQLSRELRHRG